MKGLREKRKNLGLTQIQLGEKIGVAGNSICYYESGKRNPNIAVLKKLAAFFNCTVDDLLNDTEG
jgi:transcriptional regulator with XRE-family HTH domain